MEKKGEKCAQKRVLEFNFTYDRATTAGSEFLSCHRFLTR